MTDITPTTLANSDQLNADDVITPMTITVTKVDVKKGESQPVIIYYEGCDGKPFKPCKSVRRIISKAWGVESANYVGRSMTVYNEKSVEWGGQLVGGIRVSHMSHIEEDFTMLVTIRRGNRRPVTIEKLPSPKVEKVKDGDHVIALIAHAKSTAEAGLATYRDWFSGLSVEYKRILTTSVEPDSADPNAVKSVHEICKALAKQAEDGEITP